MGFGEKNTARGEGGQRHFGAYYLPLWLVLGMAFLFVVPEFRGMMDPERPTPFGVDFYHFWGVAHAKGENAAPLGSPWPDSSRYAKVLERSAKASADPLQRAAQRHRRELDLTSTPWTYAMFAAAPQGYERALRHFRVGGLILLLASLLILGHRWFGSGAGGLILALLLCLCFIPVRTDLRVGNTGLLVLAFFMWSAMLLESAQESQIMKNLLQGLAFALVLLGVLLKPTWWWVLIGVCFHLWNTRETERSRGLLWLCFAATMGFFLLPIFYFADFGIWSAWLNSIILQGGSRLSYAVDQGNFSSLKLIARAMDSSWRLALLPTFGVMVLPLFRYRRTPVEALKRFEDPGFSLSVGITASLAFSPLCWVHYFLLLILPALNLARTRKWWTRGIAMGSLILSAGLVDHWLAPHAGGRAVVPWLFGLSWLPLWWALWSLKTKRNERIIGGVS